MKAMDLLFPDHGVIAAAAAKALEIDCETGQPVFPPLASVDPAEGSFKSSEKRSCFDMPFFLDAKGIGCDGYAANRQTTCSRYGANGTLALANSDGVDASMACCACGGGVSHDPTPTLYDSDGGFICSGTLIHSHYVLTSAECAMLAKGVVVSLE